MKLTPPEIGQVFDVLLKIFRLSISPVRIQIHAVSIDMCFSPLN